MSSGKQNPWSINGNMKTTFKTFQSNVGDCIFLLLSEKKKQFSIMVDCGLYEPAIKQYVNETLKGVIDLLIVTHIDDDHIKGVTQMLSGNVKVNRIIFNSYQREHEGDELQGLNDDQMALLRRIGDRIGLIVDDVIPSRATRSGKTAMKGLAATILGNPELKPVWERPYTLNGTELDLNDWGKIAFLSPTMKEIKNLDKEFCKVLFDELNVEKDMGEWDKRENLYEVLLRYVMRKGAPALATMKKGKEPMTKPGAATLEERLLQAADEPVETQQITPANQASLAFVWEKDGHRVLVLGDANPDVVVAGLRTHYKEQAFPVLFDAIKVSHHGSHYNTTRELVQCADSEHYFFTGGMELKRPSEAAVGRIALCPLPNGLQKRTLHFNYPTSLVEELKKNRALKGKYKFGVDTKKNELKINIL